MAIFYLDYEGGNDANDGTTFANRWKTFASGATAARIAPGDTIRVMGSPAPTSLGVNGTWTGDAYQSTGSITSSTNTTPISVKMAAASYSATGSPVAGDTIYITGHTTNTNANGSWKCGTVTTSDSGVTYDIPLLNADGANSVGNGVGGATGSVRKITNRIVTLASALTKAIACTGNRGTKTNWTASANVTCSVNTADFKEGAECQSIAIAAGFTTGLAAYWPLGSAQDFSAYQQIAFWIKQTAGTIGAEGACTISLCSDTAGATPVNTVNIPALGALNQWMPVVVDTAGALGASIQSVAFNVVTDNGAQTFLIDNIIACKASSSADSLNLTSLVGKNTAGETWYGIQSINDVRVLLDQHVNMLPSGTTRGYAGVTETVTTYKRETIKPGAASASSTNSHDILDSGSVGLPIVFSGGWNRTDMSSQTLETWLDGQNGNGRGLCCSSNRSYISFDKISCVRYYRGTNMYIAPTSFISYDNAHFNNNSVQGCLTPNAYGTAIGTMYACCNGGSGVDFSNGSNVHVTGKLVCHSNGTSSTDYGVSVSNNSVIEEIIAKNNISYGVCFSSQQGSLVKNLTTQYNGVGGVLPSDSNGSGGINYVKNAYISEATVVGSPGLGCDSKLTLINYGGVAGDNRIYCDSGLIQTETIIRHTPSGYSWKLSPTSANRDVNYPLSLSVAKVACAANALVTVKAWLRRSNTGLTMRLMCKGGQIGGVAADVSSSMTAAADTWEELTITFTPNEAGTVEITAEAYGGSTYSGYVDDMTISQA